MKKYNIIPVLFLFCAFTCSSLVAQNKIYFNRIVCLNHHGKILYPDHSEYALTGSVPEKFPGIPQGVGKYLEIAGTYYYDNMSITAFPENRLNEGRFAKYAGSQGAGSNDEFYITYKDKAREGMVLPVLGGYKEMFRYAFWKPTAGEGNPALAGGDKITYYLWEANQVQSDTKLGNLTIDLKTKKGKGPQLALIINPSVRDKTIGRVYDSSVYVIEYEVK